MMKRFWLVILGLVTITGWAAAGNAEVVHVFNEQTLHFSEDNAAEYCTAPDSAGDNGRMVFHEADLPDWEHVEIMAFLRLLPIPKSEVEVQDRYDRAGNICLVQEDGSLLELIRFMTAFGGPTEHEVDLSEFQYLLRGKQTFRVFVDTWGRPGWKVDLALEYRKVEEDENPDWARGIYEEKEFNRQEMPDGVEVTVDIPDGLERVVMVYTSTGHCTDGRDEDEFVSKPNVIYVDDVPVFRYHPWRDDCRENRGLNPYTGKWTNNVWSSDYSRSGWCPGRLVIPVEIDLTDHLTPGKHTVRFKIENMRPKDENGNYGFWRVSSSVIGWKEYPNIWVNEEE